MRYFTLLSFEGRCPAFYSSQYCCCTGLAARYRFRLGCFESECRRWLVITVTVTRILMPFLYFPPPLTQISRAPLYRQLTFIAAIRLASVVKYIIHHTATHVLKMPGMPLAGYNDRDDIDFNDDAISTKQRPQT